MSEYYFPPILETRGVCLSADEIRTITGFSHAKRQLEVLQAQGYPAFMRPDNTVSLGRAQYERGPEPKISGSGNISRPTVQQIPRNGKTKKVAATAS